LPLRLLLPLLLSALYLSFRSEAKESAVVIAIAVVSPFVCHPRRDLRLRLLPLPSSLSLPALLFVIP
jgi:hypothetical protein